jgi:hypothetical protein
MPKDELLVTFLYLFKFIAVAIKEGLLSSQSTSAL